MSTESRIARLERDLERLTGRVPLRAPNSSPTNVIAIARVDGGQTLRVSPLVTGLVGVATLPTSIAAGLDPGSVNASTGVETVAATGTYPDGIGYGTLADVGTLTTTYTRVIIGCVRNIAMPPSLCTGWIYLATGTTSITNAGGGTYTVYLLG